MRAYLPLCALLVHLLGLPRSGESCSCLEDVGREETIRDSFCYSSEVYRGQVVAATCNCIPSGVVELEDGREVSSRLNCQHYQLELTESIINASILEQGQCDLQRYYSNNPTTCSSLANSLMTWGLTVEGPITPSARGEGSGLTNLTRANGQACRFACPFNMIEGVEQVLPCTYTVRVVTVFKGNISVGEEREEHGPDILTSCGDESRRLEISTHYLVGVGSSGCGPISDWTEFSEYSDSERELIESLGQEAELKCGAGTVLPSSGTVLLSSLLLVALTTLTTLT